ncbi:DMT family transporter [Streptomyces sp. A7024]|uniref:DMT family transporter n=1 Tax=Streptomyces coryli TaxID=1128680 RepID=A0A6G4UD72_9ACTN|nr:DMT family transporter [Streptomyces coryli]NGN69287.1 DMT family transporter [Streptomyces coryli]
MPGATAGYGIAAGLVVFWSSGFIGAELGTREAPADTLLMWRFIAATALLGGVWLLIRVLRGGHARPRITRRAFTEQAAIGTLSQGGYLGAIVWSVGLGVPTGTAALIAALQPLAAGALAGRLLGETVTRRQWTGLIIGLVGVAMVVRDDMSAAGTTPVWAYTLPFAGMAALLGASFLERRAKAPLPAFDALPIHCLTSAALFSAVALTGGRGAPPSGGAFWAAVAWVVLLSTVGGYGFYWLSLSRRGVTRTSALMYLTPPTTAVWAYAMFGDTPGPLAVAGMAVSLAGVIAATAAGGRRPRSVPVQQHPRQPQPAETGPIGSAPDPADLTSAKEPQSGTVR